MKVGNNAFRVLKNISFERLGGTKEEFKALEIIKKEIEHYKNVELQVEEFEVDSYAIEKVELSVVEPKNIKINATGFGMASSTNEEGVVGEFYYIENTNIIKQLPLENKIVLVCQSLSYQVYEDLLNSKVKGIITTSGSIYDDLKNTDLEERKLRERHYKLGKIPAVTIRMKDAEKLILSEPKMMKLVLIQKETKALSHNLVATINGFKYPNEVICFTAHYDSVRFSTGAYDNGTGSVTILELLHYYAKKNPSRTLKFIWCGSEEMGLLGSHAFVNKHEDELKNYKLCINVDMTGVVIGKDIAVCTSENSLVNFIDYLGKKEGFIISVSQGVYSSDSTPFANKDVPAVSFARIAPRGGAEIHSRKDILSLIKPLYLEKTINFIEKFADEMINSVYFPVPKTMPQNMKDDLDKYLGVKKNV